MRRYYALIGAHRYDDAWALWSDAGAASGMGAEAFAASFDRYATYRATVGTPFDADAGAGQRYISVPVSIAGMLRTGTPFALGGSLVLHRVADGIDGTDPAMHLWRIRESRIEPPPAAASGSRTQAAAAP